MPHQTNDINDFIPPDAPIRTGEPEKCPKHFYELDGPCRCPPTNDVSTSLAVDQP